MIIRSHKGDVTERLSNRYAITCLREVCGLYEGRGLFNGRGLGAGEWFITGCSLLVGVVYQWMGWCGFNMGVYGVYGLNRCVICGGVIY